MSVELHVSSYSNSLICPHIARKQNCVWLYLKINKSTCINQKLARMPCEMLITWKRYAGHSCSNETTPQMHGSHCIGLHCMGCTACGCTACGYTAWGCTAWGCTAWGCTTWICTAWICTAWGCTTWGCTAWDCTAWGCTA